MHHRHLLLGLTLFILIVSAPVHGAQTTVPAHSESQAESANASSKSDAKSPELSESKTLIDQGKYDEAIQNLSVLSVANPQTRGIQHQLAVAYYRKGDFPKAENAFTKAVHENPNDHEAVQLLGLSLYQLGRPAEAIGYLKQAQSWIGETNVQGAYVLGLCYIQTQKYDEARKSFATMYNVPTESAAAHLFLARMLLRQGYDPVAEQNALQAATIDPKLPLVHYLLGEFYLYKSNVAKAVDEFEEERKMNPAYAPTYDRLGDSYSRLGKYDDAERVLQSAILLDATSTGPYILMGKVLNKKKDYPLAASYLQKAIKMDPSNYISHHLMGEAYRGLGRPVDADRELKRAQELQSATEPKLDNAP
jgi:tetratricopeptide (TPR) repeat protein